MLGINMGDMSIVDMIKPLFGLFEGDFDFPVVISSVLEPVMGMFTGQLKMIGIDLDAIMPEVYIKILILFKMNDVWYLKSSIKKIICLQNNFSGYEFGKFSYDDKLGKGRRLPLCRRQGTLIAKKFYIKI